MAGLSVSSGDDVLKRFGNQIGSLSERDGERALSRAVNRTTTAVQGRVIRAVVKQSSIPRQIVKSEIKKQTTSAGGFGGLEGM